jgi:hypothetical protein
MFRAPLGSARLGGHMISDLTYYRRRVAEERTAGMTAATAEARACHFALADAYEARVREIDAEQRRASLHIVTAA